MAFTLLIRDYVKIMGGNKPDPGKQVIVKWKPVPIPARHIRRYIKENFLSLVELDRVTGSDVIDHCLENRDATIMKEWNTSDMLVDRNTVGSRTRDRMSLRRYVRLLWKIAQRPLIRP